VNEVSQGMLVFPVRQKGNVLRMCRVDGC